MTTYYAELDVATFLPYVPTLSAVTFAQIITFNTSLVRVRFLPTFMGTVSV